MTRFKELCLDVHGDVAAMGEFWAAATGCQYDDGDVVGDVEGMGIALCPVPEPKTVKHRVHLDVHTDSVDTVLGAGGHDRAGLRRHRRRLDGAGSTPRAASSARSCATTCPAYKLLRAVRRRGRRRRAHGRLVGRRVRRRGAQPAAAVYWWLEGVPGMPFELMVFDPVPEPKTVKNRIHWDVVRRRRRAARHGRHRACWDDAALDGARATPRATSSASSPEVTRGHTRVRSDRRTGTVDP